MALLLDLRLRADSKGARSLDDLMRVLWQRHGLTGVGVEEDGLFALAAEIGGPALGRWLRELVEGTEELPLDTWLKRLGLTLAWDVPNGSPGLGVRTAADGEAVRLANVYDGGAAQAAGLSAGDVLVALDGIRITSANLDKLLARRLAGETVRVHAFRRDELMAFEVELQAAPADTAKLVFAERSSGQVKALREAWLTAAA